MASVCSGRMEAVRDSNAGPSGQKIEGKLRDNAYLHLLPCKRLHGTEIDCTQYDPTALYGPSESPPCPASREKTEHTHSSGNHLDHPWLGEFERS